jgi:hypothetical protein
MSTNPLKDDDLKTTGERDTKASTRGDGQQAPPRATEQRLLEIRHEAEQRGEVKSIGVRPAGAPFPVASPETGYYGIPLLKEPQWTMEIPPYFFVGGAAGGCAVIAAMADWIANDNELAQQARWVAFGGTLVSSALLISDLGRPDRFINMLRVFKPQSPMSMGAWTLTAFGSASAAALFAKTVERRLGGGTPIRVLGNVSQFFSALFGLPFHNYTGVLIGATVIPVWNRNIKTLPIHFGASGGQAGVALLELMGNEDNRALNWLGAMACAFETWEGYHLETRHERELKPLKHGKSGLIVRTGGVLSGPLALALRLIGGSSGSARSRRLRKWAAVCGIVGSLCTRYGWIAAGKASARDWRIPLEIEERATGEVSEFPEVPQAKTA